MNGQELARDPDAYGPQIMAGFLEDFIDRRSEQPFFIYYPMVLPHDPFVPTPDSPEWADPDRRVGSDTIFFDDMIAYVDQIIGRLEAKLREKGVWENTLFIFTGDNGTNRKVVTSTIRGEVSGGKGLTLNVGNHVPLIVSWPQKISESRVFSGLIDFSDFLPTLADAAGISPEKYVTGGKSFYPVIAGSQSRKGKEEIFIHYAPRWGKLKHNRWVMNGNYKLYRDGRFYDTKNDLQEVHPLAKLTEEESRLKATFQRILEQRENEISFDLNDKEYKVADKF